MKKLIQILLEKGKESRFEVARLPHFHPIALVYFVYFASRFFLDNYHTSAGCKNPRAESAIFECLYKYSCSLFNIVKR